MEDQDDDTGMSRKKRSAIICSSLVFFVIFFVASAAFLIEPDGTYYMRRPGMKVPITRELGLAVLVPMLFLCAACVGWIYWRNLRHLWRTTEPQIEEPDVGSDKPVLWSARNNWRSFRGGRVAGSMILITMPSLLLLWIWNILTGESSITLKLFFILLPLSLLCCTVIPIIVVCLEEIKSWLFDVIGSIEVTHEGITWLTPMTQQVYRTVCTADLIDVWLIDSHGKRGSLVIVRRVDDDVEHVYLHGLLDSERVQAAVQSLITNPCVV
ncbi:hypothetical protein [Croceibacterium ferulae]|uniref:hypothetical protein n=1 Tax=Croceibacterium ferulae TaxID=1854641 RepID=UPI000EB2207B|nr:hypothetical protein [Croceibacterium ferulae]